MKFGRKKATPSISIDSDSSDNQYPLHDEIIKILGMLKFLFYFQY